MTRTIEHKSGDSWRLTVSLGTEKDGQRVYKRRTVTTISQAEAEKKLALFVADLNNARRRKVEE